jgi:hypothetical protein
MRTLVIHPTDITTDFLKVIYADKGWTVVNEDKSKAELIELIEAHDRIVMLGHGTEDGLLGFKWYAVDNSLVKYLRSKECVCVWCHAKGFVERYKLKGFYTDMFISEVYEAMYHNVKATAEEIEDSNNSFANALSRAIDTESVRDNTLELYEDNSLVSSFNRKRLYFKS